MGVLEESGLLLKRAMRAVRRPKPGLRVDEERPGVLGEPVAPELEVEVRPGGDLPGVAAEGDRLAAADAVAGAREKARFVLIDGKTAVGAQHGNDVPALMGPVREDDVAVADNAVGRAFVHCKDHAVVTSASAEAARDEAVHG